MYLQTGKALHLARRNAAQSSASLQSLKQHSLPLNLTRPVTACCGEAHMSGRGPGSCRSARWARPWSQAAWIFWTAAFVCAALGSAPLGIAWTLQVQPPLSGSDPAPVGSVGSGACHHKAA